MSYQMPQQRRITTVKIVTIYALFGLSWIYGSDTVLGWIINNPTVMVKISVVKGSLFVICTAVLLYILISHFVQQLAVSERNQIESLKNYQVIFNATNEAIFIHDVQSGRILDVNDRMLDIYGYKRDEVLSVDIGQLSEGTPPYSQAEATDIIRKATFEGPQVFEWLSRRKNGESFWSEVSLKRITTHDYDKIIAVVRDISARKQAEDELRTSEERNRVILDSAMDGFWRVSQQGKILEVNEAYCHMSGYSKQELLAMSIADLEANETAADAVAHNQKIMEQGEDRFVAQHRRKDGTVFDVEVSAKFVPADGGLLVGFQRDVTDRKRSEELLRVERDRAQGYLDTVETIIVALDTEGIIVTINRKACQILGYSEDELLGKSWFETCLPKPEGTDTVYPYFLEIMAGIQTGSEYFENPIVTRTGEKRHIAWHNALLRDKQGQIYGTLSAGEDITKRKQTEIELIEAKTAAESANRTKSQFLANMSHEIRTPINGIIGIAQLLEMTELSQEQKEYAEILILSSNNLLKLISDILDLSRIEAGMVDLETQNFDLKEELSSTIHILSLLAHGKGLEFSLLINPDVPIALRGDQERLRQIITNLIGNAIKFTEKGSISLHISKDAEDEQHTTLRFNVRDSGIGIASVNIRNIFEAFKQADGSTSRKYGGTGLGLTITRHLVELMGGNVGVESLEGEGSMFWFTVMLEKQAEAPGSLFLENIGVASSINGTNIRILLVEDDKINQLATSRLLSKKGFKVDVANDGSEGVKLLEEYDYDLVLMDCMMPVMDGYKATAAVRNQTSKVRNHDIPIIALTANALREDRDICLASGMDDYLSKPIEVTVLLAMLEKWLKLKEK